MRTGSGTKRGQADLADLDLILAACRRGDPDAWEALVERYERLVYAIARREGLDPEDAADATQLTFEALLDSLDRVQNGPAVGAWLSTVARRQAWRQRERRRREAVLLQAEARDGLEAVHPVDGPFAPDDDRTVGLYEALMDVGEPCRSLLFLLYFDPARPSYAEVALKTKRPVGSIEPTARRCLQRLRSALSLTEAS